VRDIRETFELVLDVELLIDTWLSRIGAVSSSRDVVREVGSCMMTTAYWIKIDGKLVIWSS
jgi:hypothetical protein